MIRVDTSQVERALAKATSQIPFALSLALNLTASKTVQYIRAHMADSFILRGKWELGGIRQTKSTKRQLWVEVGSVHEYMRLHVSGGEKRSGRGMLAIPKVGAGRPRRTITSPTRPSVWPSRLLRRSDVFAGTVKTSRGPVYGIWRRQNRGVQLLYALQAATHLPARWPMVRQVTQAISSVWPEVCAEAVRRALSTIK